MARTAICRLTGLTGSQPWLRGTVLCRCVQLEDIDVVTKSEHTKGGRAITPNGQRDLDLIAGRIERAAEEEEEEEPLEE